MAKKKAEAPRFQKKHIIISGAVVAGTIVVVLGLIIIFYPKRSTEPPTPFNQFRDAINKLVSQPVPADPITKAQYYAQIAQNYDYLQEYQTAISYYRQAQDVIDQNKLTDQIVYYAALAIDYQAINDKANAKTNWQKRLQWLQTWQKAHPDDDSTKAAIKNVQDKLSQL